MTIQSAKVSIFVEAPDGSTFSYEFPTSKDVVFDSIPHYVENKTSVGETMLHDHTEISLAFKAYNNPATGKWCGLDVPKPEVNVNPLESVTKLIVDMTLKGATIDELNRAIYYSKAVLDSTKTPRIILWTPYLEYGIQELQAKYQGGSDR